MKVRFEKENQLYPCQVDILIEAMNIGEFGVLVHFTGDRTIHFEEKGNWIDLMTAEEVSLDVGEFKLIDLGLSMRIPRGFEAHLAPRSSTFKKWGIIQVNSVGIIDTSYSGTNDIWKMPVYATRAVTIPKGTRIAQFRFVKTMENELFDEVSSYKNFPYLGESTLVFIECDELPGEDRGGFGSTGN